MAHLLLALLIAAVYSVYAEGERQSEGCKLSKQSAYDGKNYTFFYDDDTFEFYTTDYMEKKNWRDRTVHVHFSTHWSSKVNQSTGGPMVMFLPGYTTTSFHMFHQFKMIRHSDEQVDDPYVVVVFEGSHFDGCKGEKCKEWEHDIITWNDETCSASPGPAGPICNNFEKTKVESVPVPDGCVNGDGYRCNWCNCHVDDTVTIELLAKYMEDNYCIDMSREYVAGFSQGGMMTHTVACEMADRFAAAAPFHGARHMGFDCTPPDGVTMPIFEVWGRDDICVPGEAVLSGTFPVNSTYQDPSGPGYYFIPRQNVIERFAEHNGCDLGRGIEKIGPDNVDYEKYGEVNGSVYKNWQCWRWKQGCNNQTGIKRSTPAATMMCAWDGEHVYPIHKNYSDRYAANGTKFQEVNFGWTPAWNFISQFRRYPKTRSPTQAPTPSPTTATEYEAARSVMLDLDATETETQPSITGQTVSDWLVVALAAFNLVVASSYFLSKVRPNNIGKGFKHQPVAFVDDESEIENLEEK